MGANIAFGNRFYPTYIAGPHGGNRNQFIQNVTDRLMDNTCPIILRRFKEAEFAYESKNLNMPSGQLIRAKLFVSMTVGASFCLATRIVRAAVRTLALPVSIPFSIGKQQYFNYSGEVKEEFKRVFHEWVDLGVTLVLPFIGVAKFFKPDCGQDFIEKLMKYYVVRIDERQERDEKVAVAIRTYRTNRNNIKEAWKRGQAAPVIVRG